MKFLCGSSCLAQEKKETVASLSKTEMGQCSEVEEIILSKFSAQTSNGELTHGILDIYLVCHG